MSKIEEFRLFMDEINVDAFILHTKDEYLNEYSEDLKQLCGFTGTNGLLIVIKHDKCPFFTDGRYITQARSQLDQDTLQIYNMQEKDPYEWVKENLTSTTTLSYYSQYFSVKDIRKYENVCNVIPYSIEKRSDHQKQGVVLYPIWYSGESSKDKCERIAKGIDTRFLSKLASKEQMLEAHGAENRSVLDIHEDLSTEATTQLPVEVEFRKKSTEAVLLSDSNSISWLLNLRNENAKYTPCILARAILYKDGNVDLFIQDKKHSTVEENLDNHINIFDISELENSLNKLASIIIDPNTTPMSIMNMIKNKQQVIEKEDPCLLHKAVKNQTEIAGAVNAHIKDGIAVTNFLYWLENNVNKIDPSVTHWDDRKGTRWNDTKGNADFLLEQSLYNEVTELDAEEKLLEYRKEQDLFKQPSFPTISAFNENGAIIHYRASNETNKVIQGDGLYLIDSGGQYLDGTTDVTRTIAIGNPTNEQITHYTIVLKAHIAIASSVFPHGTTGGELDILARAHLWKFGMDYMHGTGHGVGTYLSVHEGPQAISKGNKIKLVPGMILSNEPGYYIPEKYGIRIENLMYVDKHENGFLRFKQLTCIPYDRKLINVQMMTNDEIEWINNYHKFAYESLKKSIKDNEWLKKLCVEI